MKKLFFILMFFMFFESVSANSLYVSKKDIDTEDYVSDCDFLLYDENNVVVDAWIAEDNTHEVSNIKNGSYTLVERPKIDSAFRNELSVFHDIDINDNSLQVVLYNRKIDTPRNLGVDFNDFMIGCSFIFLGIFFLYVGCRKFYYF